MPQDLCVTHLDKESLSVSLVEELKVNMAPSLVFHGKAGIGMH